MIQNIEIDLTAQYKSKSSLNRCPKQKSKKTDLGENLSTSKLKDVILQAFELGANKILLYNNPTHPHPDTEELTEFITKNGILPDVSTSVALGALPQTPCVIKCLKHKYSCFVTLDGDVFPCKGLPLPIGNLHDKPLKKILVDSEIIQNLKNHESMIKGPCRKCNKFSNCYGCRARTYALTGDYLASDPICPENQDKLHKITYLPMGVENLIPQKLGMRVVSSLLSVEERFARVESLFLEKSPFVKKDRSLEEVVYMEIMAQSAAVMNGFSKFDTDTAAPGGFLIGGNKINIYKKSYIKEKLITDIYKTAKFGNFGILTATIKREDEIIAEGEIKIYQTDGE